MYWNWGPPYYTPVAMHGNNSPTLKDVQEALEFFKNMEKMIKEKEKEEKEKDKKKDEKPKAKTFTFLEVLALLTLFSPIVGPLYLKLAKISLDTLLGVIK